MWIRQELLAETGGVLHQLGASLPRMQNAMAAFLAGGKRIRARLLLAVGGSGQSINRERLVRYATFVELIHAAGLCHDDIVDGSSTRRGRASMAAAHGVPAAAAGGLYLMARALELVAGEEARIRAIVADAAWRAARGQAREMTDLYREDVSIEDYLRRCSDKTASLFELAAQLGAVASGVSLHDEKATATFGRHVGLAFQLADDLRDIVGGPLLGRERGTDIREGVYTLPILLTLSERREGWTALRSGLRRARLYRRQPDVDACCDIVDRNGSLHASARILHRHLADAAATSRRIGGSLGEALGVFAGDLADGVGEITGGGQ